MMRASLRSAGIVAASAIVMGSVIAGSLPGYWVYLATAVLITAINLLSLGIVEGRTGMISLCQLSFAGVGAWTVGYLNVAGAPGGLPLWILIGGFAAMPFGIAIGVPALRLRGINLAIVTLGFAGAFDAILAANTFPGQTSFLQVPRPEIFETDQGYFVFVMIVFALMAGGLELVAGSRLGSSWLSIRHSERAAAAHGVGIPSAKLGAFALSAFVAGVAGGLLAGYLGTLVADNFALFGSLALFAVATMTGAQYAEGAILGGLLVTLFPELLRRLDLPQDIGNVLFAVGAVQALSSGESMSEGLRRWYGRLRTRRFVEAVSLNRSDLPPSRDHGDKPALVVRGLTVRYGAVIALDNINLDVPARCVTGLIGPNGAGKSTFIDAVAGFLAHYEGRIELQERPLEGLLAHARARLGVRRTWQTNRISPDLSLGAYLTLAAGDLTAGQLRAALAWIGCSDPDLKVAKLDVGTRRLLDVAAVVAARPVLALLDEPAAGQSYDEALLLAKRIAEIPRVFGSAVLLVDHDMDLVRAACESVAVLDFGTVIALGKTSAVLDLPIVRRAYLGIGETEAA
ncbi:branched-chain amino acid ABC transporter ATP-binding protein/permease [Bradyrhizobium sp. KB893862 SZCCT0404]|uniref:ABC transporter permease subunit n=1 Tax=Bradyrhizobium sp. KB893862 SZCCT0404 TaxID=2807672 RepID=UPI001BA4DCD0|nr:ATP-binding cassette domain-containing protein [Bradyrhizobium sp. KB893862 SZCCT0404]MBR1177168.1 branched-chain amino acid ABC transporter ATP-binding protein/permease [Bradyrhizobium sp. KB893862 SZCCT0404]